MPRALCAPRGRARVVRIIIRCVKSKSKVLTAEPNAGSKAASHSIATRIRAQGGRTAKTLHMKVMEALEGL